MTKGILLVVCLASAILGAIVANAAELTIKSECLLPPSGGVGLAYKFKLEAEAGTAPYSFKIDSGELPPGLSMSTEGLIAGTPTTSGTFKFAAKVGDSQDKHVVQDVSIAIKPPNAASLAEACNPDEKLDKPGWKLTFHDEFDGSTLDLDRWVPRYRNSLSLPATYVLKDGLLHLRIDRDSPPPRQKGGGRVSGIETRGAGKTFAQQYGRFELRARCATGGGVQSAFWLSPLDNSYNAIKAEGGTRAAVSEATEIDSFEQLGLEPQWNNFTIHYGGAGTEGSDARHSQLPFDLQKEFHIYAVEWNPSAVVWFVDDKEVHRSDKVPHTPYFIRLSMYEGDSEWRGKVNPADPYPKDFEIDYIRVYKKG